MNTQPLFHRDDPDTSRLAADDMIESGAAQSHCQIIARLIRLNPCLTSMELSHLADCSLEYHQIARRMNELIKADIVVADSDRECLFGGRLMTTYCIREGR